MIEHLYNEKVKIIALEGVHAVGKSTILNSLRKDYKVYEERPCDFIPHQPFATQMYFLSGYIERDYQIRKSMEVNLGKIIILDRTALSALTYGYATLPPKQFKILLKAYNSYKFLREDLIFLLHLKPKSIIERMKKRTTDMQDLLEGKLMDANFINLVDSYLHKLILERRVPCVKIDTENLTPAETVIKIKKSIKNYVQRLEHQCV